MINFRGEKLQPYALTLTVNEAGKLLGLSRNSSYAAIRRGEIPSVRIGKRILVPRAALQKLLNGDEAG